MVLGLSSGQTDLLIVTSALKILLYPAYRSTDFEVHRNWLAITHNLPISKWYFDTTSEWTLDYPPFFAYFSYLLSLPARLLPSRISNEILKLSSTPIETWETICYMRTTVLLSEICLVWGLLRLAKSSKDPQTQSILSLSIALHPGFLILDSIHFQYNGFLFGLMIWSLVGAREGRPLMCAGFFAGLLNFKHIYVYLAPAWFIYLFRAYVFPPTAPHNILNLVKIGATTLGVFAVSLGPFLALGQGPQLLSRLFPFTRGLMHAYWAPNAWAGVTVVDRILLKLSSRLDFLQPNAISKAGVISTSRGLVGDTFFAVIPDVKPIHCFALTAIVQLVLLTELWKKPDYKTFLRSIAHCGFASFMFGWHVHEKAIMLVLVPLSLLAVEDYNHFRSFVITSVAGTFSLFPLLFTMAETPVKLVYSLTWAFLTFASLNRLVYTPPPTITTSIIHFFDTSYMFGFPLIQLFTSVIHPYLLSPERTEKWAFLPLMITSVYCSVGVWWGWFRLMYSSWKALTSSVQVDSASKSK